MKALRNLIFWNLVEKKTVNSADGILFTCQEELELARTTFSGYRPRKELNVGYGIRPPKVVTDKDIASFRQKHGITKDESYLLFLSRIHPKKGLLNLVKAYVEFTKMKSALPKLVVAGPGADSAFGKSILDLVNGDSAKRNIIFPGMLTGTDKWAAFHGAKAFVLPSHQENFGIAVAEALACGCPVLISNKVNIWREIVDGEAGLVEEDTLKGTYALLEKFSELTEEKLTKLGVKAIKVYRNHFTIAQAAGNLLEALKGKQVS